MKQILNTALLILAFGLASCESSDDISNSLDHQVPDCKSLTLTADGQTKTIDDAIVTKLLWGYVPTTNLETISLPTVTATKGSKLTMSIVLSDNVALKTVELSYSTWLLSKYINFSNPEGDIPLTPKSYTFTTEIDIPADAVSTPWIENYYFNDGSLIKITQPYHKISLTVTDVNLNKRIVAIFVKIQ
jgi:hypothetical protein